MLGEAGDPSRAAQLLTWLEAGQGPEWGALVAVAEGPTYLERGRIEALLAPPPSPRE